jgi:hypothetical protein
MHGKRARAKSIVYCICIMNIFTGQNFPLASFSLLTVLTEEVQYMDRSHCCFIYHAQLAIQTSQNTIVSINKLYSDL